jgi:hypothetical protein
MRPVFAAGWQRYTTITVDGSNRLLASWIARRVGRMTLREAGLEVC